VTTRLPRTLIALAGSALVLVGCSSSPSGDDAAASSSAGSSAPASQVEPPAAQSEAAAEAAADPAAATDGRTAGLASALRVGDLPDGWTVQSNPTPDDDLGDSLAGICGYTFTSEARRTAKFAVVGIDPAGSATVASEAIVYDSPDGAALALTELRAAYGACPPDQYTFTTPPPADGLQPGAVVVTYELGDTQGAQAVVAQARGSVVSIVLGSDAAVAVGAGTSIARRLAALPAAAVGG
jgi:hypothetical protein